MAAHSQPLVPLSSARPRILVTNDDGIDSPGLAALRAALVPLGDVTVVAPDCNRTGAARSITMRTPLWVEEVQMADGGRGLRHRRHSGGLRALGGAGVPRPAARTHRVGHQPQRQPGRRHHLLGHRGRRVRGHHARHSRPGDLGRGLRTGLRPRGAGALRRAAGAPRHRARLPRAHAAERQRARPAVGPSGRGARDHAGQAHLRRRGQAAGDRGAPAALLHLRRRPELPPRGRHRLRGHRRWVRVDHAHPLRPDRPRRGAAAAELGLRRGRRARPGRRAEPAAAAGSRSGHPATAQQWPCGPARAPSAGGALRSRRDRGRLGGADRRLVRPRRAAGAGAGRSPARR